MIFLAASIISDSFLDIGFAMDCFKYVWTSLSCLFLSIGLVVAVWGIVRLHDASTFEYRPANCILVKSDGPKEVSCKNRGGCTYSCTYTMTSDITGNKEFDVRGSADKDRCTQFQCDQSTAHLDCKTNCNAKFKNDEAVALTFFSQGQEKLGSTLMIIFGFLFSLVAACFVCSGLSMFQGMTSKKNVSQKSSIQLERLDSE